MKEEVIIEAAKKYEKSTEFGNIVLRAKEVNSAAGIGFLEGAVWMQEQMMQDAITITFSPSLPSEIFNPLWINGAKDGDKIKLVIIEEV